MPRRTTGNRPKRGETEVGGKQGAYSQGSQGGKENKCQTHLLEGKGVGYLRTKEARWPEA